MAQRHPDEPSRRRVRAGRALPRLDQGDLGAYEGTVGDVVVPQGRRCGVTGVFAVLGKEECRGLGRTERLEVHGQERGVIETVDVPECVVELQAVEDPRSVAQAEDVVGEKVTVPIEHSPLFDAETEQRLAPREIAADQPFDLPGLVPGRTLGRQDVDLRETGLPPRRQGVPGPLFRDGGAPGAAECQAARCLATARRSSATGAPVRTRCDRRRSSGMRRITTSGSASCSPGVRSSPRPRYTSGANRRLSSISRSHTARRDDRVV